MCRGPDGMEISSHTIHDGRSLQEERNKSTYNWTTSHPLNVGRGIVNVVPRLATTAVRGVAQTKPVANFVDQGHTQGSLLIFPN